MKRELMRRRLLDAAEGVLVAEGPRGATVRAITSAAGVNVAAVSTAFGGRSALLDELFARVMIPINTERERRYLEVGASRAVEEVVRAFVEPLGVIASDPGSAIGSLLHALLLDAEGIDHPLDRILRDPGVSRFVEELSPRLPQLAMEEIRSRVRIAVGAIFAAAVSRSDPIFGDRSALSGLVRFVGAGLESDSMTRRH